MIGQKVRITRALDYSPHALVVAGETGTIIARTEDAFGGPTVWVRLDQQHRGLAEWNNYIWFDEHTLPFEEACIRIDTPSCSNEGWATTFWRVGITGTLGLLSLPELKTAAAMVLHLLRHLTHSPFA